MSSGFLLEWTSTVVTWMLHAVFPEISLFIIISMTLRAEMHSCAAARIHYSARNFYYILYNDIQCP